MRQTRDIPHVSGNTAAHGHNWTTADIVTLSLFDDCARINFIWFDGAEIIALHDTTEGALDHLAALGYGPGGAQ